jgi:hypothetical protein
MPTKVELLPLAEREVRVTNPNKVPLGPDTMHLPLTDPTSQACAIMDATPVRHSGEALGARSERMRGTPRGRHSARTDFALFAEPPCSGKKVLTSISAHAARACHGAGWSVTSLVGPAVAHSSSSTSPTTGPV